MLPFTDHLGEPVPLWFFGEPVPALRVWEEWEDRGKSLYTLDKTVSVVYSGCTGYRNSEACRGVAQRGTL